MARAVSEVLHILQVNNKGKFVFSLLDILCLSYFEPLSFQNCFHENVYSIIWTGRESLRYLWSNFTYSMNRLAILRSEFIQSDQLKAHHVGLLQKSFTIIRGRKKSFCLLILMTLPSHKLFKPTDTISLLQFECCWLCQKVW